jgi:hypothetical protein
MERPSSEAEWSLVLAPLLQRAGRVIESEISGISMGRTLRTGTRIRIRCEDPSTARCGRVVAIMTGRGLVGHRLVWRGTDRPGRPMVLTRGDGTPICDPPIREELILGEITEWYLAPDWCPVPAAQSEPPLRRAVAAAILLAVRLGLAVDVRVGARAAGLFAAIGRRLGRPGLPA